MENSNKRTVTYGNMEVTFYPKENDWKNYRVRLDDPEEEITLSEYHSLIGLAGFYQPKTSRDFEFYVRTNLRNLINRVEERIWKKQFNSDAEKEALRELHDCICKSYDVCYSKL